jgi:hypothetical protein
MRSLRTTGRKYRNRRTKLSIDWCREDDDRGSHVHGRGVRPRLTPEGTGTSFLYIPVIAPNNNTFGCIGLRAMDNTTAGLVRAEFWRRPRNAAPGPAVLLGAVNTVDVLVPADGFQFQVAPFAAVVINYNLFTYTSVS